MVARRDPKWKQIEHDSVELIPPSADSKAKPIHSEDPAPITNAEATQMQMQGGGAKGAPVLANEARMQNGKLGEKGGDLQINRYDASENETLAGKVGDPIDTPEEAKEAEYQTPSPLSTTPKPYSS